MINMDNITSWRKPFTCNHVTLPCYMIPFLWKVKVSSTETENRPRAAHGGRWGWLTWNGGGGFVGRWQHSPTECGQDGSAVWIESKTRNCMHASNARNAWHTKRFRSDETGESWGHRWQVYWRFIHFRDNHNNNFMSGWWRQQKCPSLLRRAAQPLRAGQQWSHGGRGDGFPHLCTSCF